MPGYLLPRDPNRRLADPNIFGEAGRPSVGDPNREPAQNAPQRPEGFQGVRSSSQQNSSNGPGQGGPNRDTGVADIYRAHSPYPFVVFGGQIAQVESFDVVRNTNNLEPAEANIEVSMDALDFSVIGDANVLGDLVPVEIWVGYLTDIGAGDSIEKQLTDLKNAILKKSDGTITAEGRGTAVQGNASQRKFSKRFHGYVYQPEYKFGNAEEMATLHCRDWIGYLKEFTIYDDFKDDQCLVKNIIARFNREIKGLKFEVFDRQSYSMADPDATDNKKIYKASGKKYGDVLAEICDRTGLKIFIDGTNIYMKLREKNPFVWKMYKGSDSEIRAAGNPFGTPFDRVTIRQGVKGAAEVGGRDLIVEVLGIGKGGGKKAKANQLKSRFPKNKEPLAGTKLITVNYPYGPVEEKEKLDIYAEEVYKKNAARQITMSMELGFGNPFMEPYDAVEFVDGDKGNMDFLKNKWFEIVSITDRFDPSGYGQQIEGRNNIEYEKAFRPKDPTAPTTPANSPQNGNQVDQPIQLQGPKPNLLA